MNPSNSGSIPLSSVWFQRSAGKPLNGTNVEVIEFQAKCMSLAPLSVDSIYFNADDQRVTNDGGEGGIRTPGTRKRTIDFESTALDHSATSPKQMGILINGLQRCEKILQRPKNADPILQYVWSSQIPVHQFSRY